MAKRNNELSALLKSRRHRFDAKRIVEGFKLVDEDRVVALAKGLASYIVTNMPAAFNRRNGVADYRTNPYVLLTSASVMKLGDPAKFAEFLFNSKTYMALETSFGKSIEATFVGQYPIGSKTRWAEAPEKTAEFASYAGLSRDERAQQRLDSVWREIDKACVVGDRRYLTTIKSGPNTINDTQVQGMTRAIVDNHQEWLAQTRKNYPGVNGIDVVVGLTYGTDKTTNNKDNQILVKLLSAGFMEENRAERPGVLIDSATRSVRVYRRVGMDFWSFIGRPDDPSAAHFVYLEILLALAKALADSIEEADMETQINIKLQQLATALASLQFPRHALPDWIREDFTQEQLFWFATAMTAFFDEGI